MGPDTFPTDPDVLVHTVATDVPPDPLLQSVLLPVLPVGTDSESGTFHDPSGPLPVSKPT